MKKYFLLIALTLTPIIGFSQNTSIGIFQDCHEGDFLHITFEGLDMDFGSGNNNYSGYNLCIEDEEGYTVPNPIYVGKRFLIKWSMVEMRIVTDPSEPRKTELVKRPTILGLELLE